MGRASHRLAGSTSLQFTVFNIAPLYNGQFHSKGPYDFKKNLVIGQSVAIYTRVNPRAGSYIGVWPAGPRIDSNTIHNARFFCEARWYRPGN